MYAQSKAKPLYLVVTLMFLSEFHSKKQHKRNDLLNVLDLQGLPREWGHSKFPFKKQESYCRSNGRRAKRTRFLTEKIPPVTVIIIPARQ